MNITNIRSALTINSDWDKYIVTVKARYRNLLVADIICYVFSESQLRLDMIEVKEAVLLPRVIRCLPSKKITLRGLGIGKIMLDELTNGAKAHGFDLIWGHIPMDLYKSWEKLPEWYEQHGFQLEKPDGSFPSEAICKVTYALSETKDSVN